jgi:hypothetical protein
MKVIPYFLFYTEISEGIAQAIRPVIAALTLP